MRNLLGKRQAFLSACNRPMWIAEQPFRLSAGRARANPGIMPTIDMPVGPVSLRIVKPTSFLCVRVRLGRFASRPARRPGAVVRLKMQAVIGGPDRQLHQAVSQRTCRGQPPEPPAFCQSPYVA